MKFLQHLAVLLAFSLVLYSCKKERSVEEGKVPVSEDETWEFTEAAGLKKGPMDSAYIQTVANVTTLSIVGSSTENAGEIFLQVVTDNLTTGAYTNPLVFFQYGENGTVLFQSSPVQTGGFTINITELDSLNVTGTFSGSVLDAQGVEHVITDGKFKSVITSWEGDQEPLEDGQLTVWAKQVCNNGEPIKISVSGQSGEITDGLLAEPSCGASGTALFTLPAGNHLVEAVCGSDTLHYEVSIVGSCTLLEIDFGNPPAGDYLPLNLGATWEYNGLDDPGTTQLITSEGTDVFDGRMYTRFVSNIGDTFYYRKEQHAYYEYRTFNFQGYVDQPPVVELPILYDDKQAGESWESAPEDITLSGIPVRAKMVFTISRRDFQASFNNVTYSDLIEVNTEILFSSNGTDYQSSGIAYNTVFAKGKGIVYYYDIDRDVEWAIKNVNLNN
jgi:hypothetical protein